MIREFKGWHMAAITIAFFAVVIAVNLTMAVLAARSWPGLLVKNSYVASQSYNADLAIAREQHAPGWRMAVKAGSGALVFTFAGSDGAPLTGLTVHATLRRPVTDIGDITLLLVEKTPGAYHPEAAIAKGLWIADVTVDAPSRAPMRFVQRIEVGQ